MRSSPFPRPLEVTEFFFEKCEVFGRFPNVIAGSNSIANPYKRIYRLEVTDKHVRLRKALPRRWA